MKVSVCIPCKDQSEKCLANIIEEVIPYFDSTGLTYDVIVCYDGSDEANQRIMEGGFGRLPGHCRLLDYLPLKGKGHNVGRCFEVADGDYTLFMDADMSTDLRCFDQIKPLLGKYDCFVASRNAKGSNITKHQPFARRLIHNLSTFVLKARFGFKDVSDTQCGYKVFRTSLARKLSSIQRIDGFAFDVEYLYILTLNGYSIKEIPVGWENDEKSSIRHPLKTSWAFYKDLGKIKKNRRSYILSEREKEEIANADR